MATTQDKEVLDFGIGVDIRDALKAIEKYQRQMAKSMKAVAKSGEKMGKTAAKAAKEATTETEELADAVKDVGKAYEGQDAVASNLAKTISELSTLAKNASGDEKKSLVSQIKALQKVDTQRKKMGAGTAAPLKGGLFFGRFTPEKVRKELEEAGEALKEPLKAFLDRDLKGVLSGSMKGAGAVLSRSLKFSKAVSGMGVDALHAKGERASLKGKAMGGARGLATRAGGAGMKGVASVMQGMGGFLKMMSSLGPLISTLSGLVVGLFTRFIDADAMVKEFNRDIMQSASNLEIFEQSGRNAEVAGVELGDTLDQLRDAAFDYTTNLAYGITKDDHKALINTLTQEGVTLGHIRQEAAGAGKSVRELATQLVISGVSFSAAFGVPLAEIGQLQSEMLTDMGRNVDETKDAFALMSRGATESGIASNKFFAAIRGFSQDLGLYNLRLEDSVVLLGKLGKVMSPKNAQKFMQGATQGLKTMGRDEKYRLSQFVGSKESREIVERDIDRKENDIVGQLKETGIDPKVLKKSLESKGYEGIKDAIALLPKALQGPLANATLQLDLQKSKASKGDWGVAQAFSDVDMGAAMEIEQKALLTDLNGKLKKTYTTLKEAVGDVGFEKIADTLGKSAEAVDQLSMMQVVMEQQRKSLLNEGGDAETVENMGWDELLATMTDEMKKSIGLGGAEVTQADKMEQFAKKQADLTTSFMRKFEILSDWFMSQFFKLVLDIWETILDLLPFGNEERKAQVGAMQGANTSGSAELIKLAAGPGNFTEALSKSGVMKDFMAAVDSRDGLAKKENALNTQIGGLESELQGTNVEDPKHKILTKQLEKAQKEKAETAKITTGINLMMNEVASGFKPEVLADALKDVGVTTGMQGEEGRAKFAKDVEDHGFREAARMLGAKDEQIDESLGKMAWASKSTKATAEVFGRADMRLQDMGLRTAPPVEEPPVDEKAPKPAEPFVLDTAGAARVKAKMEAALVASSGAAGSAPSNGTGALGTPALPMGGAGNRALTAGPAVNGISNGTAVVAARGEGLAAAGRSDRTATSNTSAPNVNVMVTGVGGRDLGNLIETKVVEGIRDYKRREKLY